MMAKARDRTRKRPANVCDQLRQAIKATNWTHYRVGKQAGIKPEIVSRFMSGERDIRAETFAKIAIVLGWELTPKRGDNDG